MAIFGVPQEKHDQLAAQLQALSSKLAQKERELQTAREHCAAWERQAKEYEAQAKENGKRAETYEQENKRLNTTVSAMAKSADGWHNFGGDTWFQLDSIVRFTTSKDYLIPDDYSSPQVVRVREIDGCKTGYPYPTLEEVMAILGAHRKARRGGRGGSGDLPDAPLPMPKPPGPTPSLDR